MLDANIMKNNNTKVKSRRLYETLTTEEREMLSKRTIGHGNMAACEDATGLFRATIMNAKNGGRLLPENAQKIRDYITSKS